jgi:threonine dehydratase
MGEPVESRRRGPSPDGSDLDPARIAAAAALIDPVFLHSPQYEDERLCRRLGRRVLVKDETRNPLRSFKGRGACAIAGEIAPGNELVCASAGNFGHGIAYASRRTGLRSTVFLDSGANPVAREAIEHLGARVQLVGDRSAGPGQEARDYAAAGQDRVLVVDGDDRAITEGAGTIGLELLAAGELDAVIVPVGDGALAAGVACAIKASAPATRVVGVCPEAAPSMLESWRRGAVTPAPARTMADGLATLGPGARSVERLRALVDEMLAVSEAGLVDAMRLAASDLGTLLEPSGAAGLAALLEHDPAGERVAVVLTGSMLRPEHLALLTDPVGGRRQTG